MLPALSAVLLVLAYPKAALWPLAWFALVPFYRALITTKRLAACGFWFGFPLFLIGCYWMSEIKGKDPVDRLIPWIGLALIQGGFFAIFASLSGRVLPRLSPWIRPMAFASAWVLFEWVRSLGQLNFPWFVLAVSQTSAIPHWPPLMLAALTGQWGLSFAIAATNGYLAEAWIHRKPHFLTAAAVSFLGASAGGMFADLDRENAQDRDLQNSTARSLRVAALQAGRDLPYGESDAIYNSLTHQASAKGARLIVWPEGVTTEVAGEALHRLGLGKVAHGDRADLLVGSGERSPHTNTVWHFSPQSPTPDRYDKRVFVPGGEIFPFWEILGPVYQRFGVTPDWNHVAGPRAGVFTLLSGAKVGTIICYESVLPWLARDCVRNGATLLTLPTSDASFGASAGPHQHLGIAKLRAVESGRYIVRAGSTGISAIITPWGTNHRELPLHQSGPLIDDVFLLTDRNVFVRWGDWFVGVCGAIAFASVGLAWRARRSD